MLDAVAWPLLVLLVLGLFYAQLRDLLNRIKSASMGGNTVDFHIKQPPAPPTEDGTIEKTHPQSGRLQREKPAHIYWLSHDLLNALLHVAQGSPEQMMSVLRQCLHHMEKAGLAGTPVHKALQDIFASIQSSQPAEWTSDRRQLVMAKISAIHREVGDIVEANQGKFDAWANK